MSLFKRAAAKLYPAVRENIFELCRAFNFEPTDQQVKALRAVQQESRLPFHQRKRRVAIKSGQGTGKTTVSVIVAVWRTLQCVDAMTIVTAPTMRQLTDVFMAEAKRMFRRAHPVLREITEFTATKIIFAGRRDTWLINCRTATKPENFQGYHDKQLTFMVDEASGVPAGIFEQIFGTLSNQDSLLFAIGNPNKRACTFFEFFGRQRAMWNAFTFNAEESPLVSKLNIDLLAKQFGRNSDVYRVRVLGEFPEMDPNSVVNADDAEACSENDILTCAFNHGAFREDGSHIKQFGIDLARYGSDESVIYRRSGNSIVEWKAFSKTDPAIVVRAAFAMQAKAGWKDSDCLYVFDAGGMGQGVAHMFHEAGKQVMEFHNAGTAQNSDYADKITEAWFLVGRKTAERSIAIPFDPILFEQLSSRIYNTKDVRGAWKLAIESKEDYRKRRVREGCEAISPDRADALCMAFYDGSVVKGQGAKL